MAKSVMAETVEALVRETNSKIVTDHAQARDGAEGHPAGGSGRDRKHFLRPVGSGLHGRARNGPADHPRRFQVDQARTVTVAEVSDADVDEALAGSRSRAGPSARRRKAQRPRRATRSRSRSPARSTACRSRAAAARTFRSSRIEHLHSGIRGPAHRHQGRRNRTVNVHVPGELPGRATRRQGRCVPGHRKVARGAGRDRAR